MHTSSRLILTAAVAGAAALLPLTAAGPAFADSGPTATIVLTAGQDTVHVGDTAGYSYTFDENDGGDITKLVGRLVIDETLNGTTTSRTQAVNGQQVGGSDGFIATAPGMLTVTARFISYTPSQSAAPVTVTEFIEPAASSSDAGAGAGAATGSDSAAAGGAAATGAGTSSTTTAATHITPSTTTHTTSGSAVQRAAAPVAESTGGAVTSSITAGNVGGQPTTDAAANTPFPASSPQPTAVAAPVPALVGAPVAAGTTAAVGVSFLPIVIAAAVVGLLGLILLALVIILIVRRSRRRIA